jgi:hypothetical protein
MADLITAPIPGMSGSTGYAQGNLDATKAYQNTLARLNQQRLSTLQQYGYTGQVDPNNGTLSGIAVDQHNPYGNLQQMLRGNAIQDQQAQWSAQDRGLRGGLANQMVSNLKYGEGQASANLGTSLQDALSGFQDQQSQAAYDRDSALYAAEQSAAEQAMLNGLFNQADYSGLDVPDYGKQRMGADGNPKSGPISGAPDALGRVMSSGSVPKSIFTTPNRAAAKIIQQKLKKKGGK